MKLVNETWQDNVNVILHSSMWYDNDDTTLNNPKSAGFLKWNNPPTIFGTIQYHF